MKETKERSRRLDRFERELRELSAQFFIQNQTQIGDSLMTVTRTSVSPDLRHAKVFVSLLNPSIENGSKSLTKEMKEELSNLSKQLGLFFGRNLRSKYTPSVSILVDESLEKALDIQKKIESISRS
ncbi:MAG: ribosome-binding factor A [Bdellovibrionales bacterium]|nr:ribosome-binding factor A [Bdellovibrionales bacterium]